MIIYIKPFHFVHYIILLKLFTFSVSEDKCHKSYHMKKSNAQVQVKKQDVIRKNWVY